MSARFKPSFSNKEKLFGLPESTPVLLYVGRVSKEKGVLELSIIYKLIRRKYAGVKMVVVGNGPDLQQLKNENPDAIFIDWVDRNELPGIYSSADLLLLPSQFDTFCNVALESLSCGLPVVAYNTKGPKDMIRNGEDGFLVNTPVEMCESIFRFLESKEKEKEKMKRSAIERAASYHPDAIIAGLMKSVGLNFM